MASLKLQDIHLPAPADIWPPAIGWWILIGLVIIIFSMLIIKLLQRAKRKKQQEKILERFTTLEQKLKEKPSNNVIAEINTLLRQLAITYYPRAEIASLTGADWLHFLDSSGNTQDFSRGAGRILIEAPYRKEDKKKNQEEHIENLNIDEFLPLIKRWAKKIVRGKI